MKRKNSVAMVAVFTAIMAAGSVVPANAQSLSQAQREHVVQQYCNNNFTKDCQGFHNGSWNDGDYNNFYRSHSNGLDAIAAGLFGFTFGAIVAGAVASQNNNNNYGNTHVARCQARYRTYNPRTDTYVGSDGNLHYCTL